MKRTEDMVIGLSGIQHLEDDSRDWAAWEEEVATGIGPVNPDMPTSTHKIACHPFSSPSCTKDPGSEWDREFGA